MGPETVITGSEKVNVSISPTFQLYKYKNQHIYQSSPLNATYILSCKTSHYIVYTLPTSRFKLWYKLQLQNNVDDVYEDLHHSHLPARNISQFWYIFLLHSDLYFFICLSSFIPIQNQESEIWASFSALIE